MPADGERTTKQPVGQLSPSSVNVSHARVCKMAAGGSRSVPWFGTGSSIQHVARESESRDQMMSTFFFFFPFFACFSFFSDVSADRSFEG